MRTIFVSMTAVVVTGLALPGTTSAQKLSFEVRGGLDRPVSDFRDAPTEARGDAGFGADVIFNVVPRFSVYGGYNWDRFSCEACGDDDWITSRGFELGGKFLFWPDEVSPRVTPWIRAGLLANQASVDVAGVDTTSDTGLGFQGSVGVDVPLGDVLSFAPALRYQRFDAEFDVIGDFLTAEETISYLSLDFGLHIHPDWDFGGR